MDIANWFLLKQILVYANSVGLFSEFKVIAFQNVAFKFKKKQISLQVNVIFSQLKKIQDKNKNHFTRKVNVNLSNHLYLFRKFNKKKKNSCDRNVT